MLYMGNQKWFHTIKIHIIEEEAFLLNGLQAICKYL